MTTKLFNKFEICTKYNRTTRYILTLDAQGYYEMAPAERSLEDAYDVPKKYSQGFVKEAVQDGMWEITKDLSEPEMVFPFYVLNEAYLDSACTDKQWKIMKGGREGYVDIKWDDGDISKNYVEISQVESMIKSGTWIVKHVGEKLPESILNLKLERCNDDKITPESISSMPVQAPQSAPLSSLSITITADTDAAVAGVDRLTASYEALCITLESLIALYKELREVA